VLCERLVMLGSVLRTDRRALDAQERLGDMVSYSEPYTREHVRVVRSSYNDSSSYGFLQSCCRVLGLLPLRLLLQDPEFPVLCMNGLASPICGCPKSRVRLAAESRAVLLLAWPSGAMHRFGRERGSAIGQVLQPGAWHGGEARTDENAIPRGHVQ
jgi:hypothetical protein